MLTFLAVLTIILTAIYGLTILLFLTGLMFPQHGEPGATKPVTVIIAAHNEQDNIGNILTDLTQQNYPRDRLQVIVVNDH